MIESRKVKPLRSQCKLRLRKIYCLIDELQDNLAKSQQTDRQVLMSVKLDRLRDKSVQLKLEEAEKENKQLLSILAGNEDTMSRISSETNCTTLSLINLQYKYEELLANHNGLLKLLDTRTNETRHLKVINERLNEEIETLREKMQLLEDKISHLSTKIKEIRIRKNNKIIRLKSERDTLRLVHNQLTYLLNRQCLEETEILDNQLRHTEESNRALLLQEIRKNNILSYENFQLQQEIEYLQSMLNIRPVKLAESNSSLKSKIGK